MRTSAPPPYCEQKAVYEDKSDIQSEEVRLTSEVNAAIKEAQQTSLEGLDAATVWRQVADIGHGAYQGLHPVMQRDGIYILGCPHVIVFYAGEPVRVVRLRGSSEYNLTGEYDNRRVGPWLTCRILDRAGFDTSNLAYVVVNYSRDTYSPADPEFLADIERVVSNPTPKVNIRQAVKEYDDIHVFGREYDPTEFGDLLRNWIQTWTGQQEPDGTDNPAKCRSCTYESDCPQSRL